MKLVFDTDVLVAALRSPSGAAAALLNHALAGDVQLLANVALFVEYEATCSRSEHLHAAGLDASQLRQFLDGLAALIQAGEVRYLWRPQLRDAADEMVLEAAVNGGAYGLVTFNRRDFGQACADFGIQLLLPREALTHLRTL